MGKDKRFIDRETEKLEIIKKMQLKMEIQEDYEFVSGMRLDDKDLFEFAWLSGYIRALKNTEKEFFGSTEKNGKIEQTF